MKWKFSNDLNISLPKQSHFNFFYPYEIILNLNESIIKLYALNITELVSEIQIFDHIVIKNLTITPSM